mmetsp:Transcript_33883/g.85665  ORF Transcript_33883/g.85665 Transcript_33883/m.85665 type:complete len:148 (+) Transcript_33883:411-854(+)
MFFLNVSSGFVFKNQPIKTLGRIGKAKCANHLTMKKLSQNPLKKISRKNFFEKSFSFLTNAGICFVFGTKNDVFAENLEKSNFAFSTKSGLKIIDFLPGETQMPQWGDFVIINYVMYKNSSQKIEKISDTYQKKTPFFIYSRGGSNY